MSDAETRMLRRRLPEETLRWVADSVGRGSRIVGVRAIGDSPHSASHALDVEDRRGERHRLTLRRFVRADWLATDPWYVPADEVAVLRLLEGTDIPAPQLVAADVEAEACDVPAILTTRLPGRSPREPGDMESFLRQMAEVLPAIHSVRDPDALLARRYEPYYAATESQVPSWSARPGTWDRVFEIIAGSVPDGPACFIHRDYHFWNTLWIRGRLTGIVDWTTGCWGPPAIDLARMRQNLAGEFGLGSADRFLDICRSVGAASGYHPYWGLLDAADSLPDMGLPTDPREAAGFARFEDYVAAVLSLL